MILKNLCIIFLNTLFQELPIGSTEKKGLLSDFKAYLKAPFSGASLMLWAFPQELKQVNCPLVFYAHEIMITDFLLPALLLGMSFWSQGWCLRFPPSF